MDDGHDGQWGQRGWSTGWRCHWNVTSPCHNQAESGNTLIHQDRRLEVHGVLSVTYLCLHLLYKPKSWGSAKILKNVDNYECGSRAMSSWGHAPGGAIIGHCHCESLIKIQISLIFWAGVKDASYIQYIMNRQEPFVFFFFKKKPVELKCQIDLKMIVLLE